MTKHYVEFFYPGILFSETSIKEIDSRDIEIEIPNNSFGYRFFDIEEIKLSTGEILTGERKNESGTFYKGKMYSLEQVKDIFPEHKTLIRNMENNEIDFIVKTNMENFQPFNSEKDKIIE